MSLPLRVVCVPELVLALVGCHGTTADLGGEDAGLGHDGGTTQGDGGVTGADGATGTDAAIGVDAESNALSGTYAGYIESFMFPDGSDTVNMTLTFATGGAVTGTVFFGSAPLLAPPTDPDVGYPPGLAQPGNSTPLEGFEFTALGGTYAAPPRLQLSVYQEQIWKQWCEIQTKIYPVDDGDNPDGGCGTFLGYGCLPNAGTQGGATSDCAISWCQQPAWTPVDCGKLLLCHDGMGACTCTATACTVQIPTTGNVAFDMQLAAGALNGSVTGLPGPQGQLYNVHLTKQ